MRIHSRLSELGEAAWDGLLPPGAPPFLRYAWLEGLEATGCVGERAGWLPHHLSFWEDGSLVAAAPAYLKTNSEGEFVFDFDWARFAEHRLGIPYYPKLVVAVPFTPATGQRLLVRAGVDRSRMTKALGEALRTIAAQTPLSSCHVLFPPEDEAEALCADGMLHRLGVQFHWRNQGYGSYDDFLGSFNAKRRHQLRRERRGMEEQGITIETLRGNDLTSPVMDAMYTFYRATVEQFTWGRLYLNRAFFEQMSVIPGVEVVIAREGGKIIAGALNLASETTLYGRYWGATVERPFLHFNVCYYHSIEDCINRKLTVFEPGAGGEHKVVRGFAPTATHSAHHLEDERLAGVLRQHLERERAAIRALIAEG